MTERGNSSDARDLAERAIKKMQQALDQYDALERLAEQHRETLKAEAYSERIAAEPCRYCDPDGTDANDLVRVDMDLGELGKIEAGMNVYLESPELSVYIELIPTDGPSEVLDEKTVKIRYCPFCGRKLADGTV